MSTNARDEDGTVLRSSATVPASDAGASTRAAPAGAGDDTHALPVGTRLGEFELTQRIGEGGFSIVYLAWDHSLDRKVALKEYMPGSIASRFGDTQIRARSERHRDTFEAGLKSFINEAKLLASFDHPALVKVYRFWEANGTAYLVMPLYEGRTLKDAVRAMPQPPDEEWLRGLLAPLTDALNVIHAEHCYHRDIAPDNIMLLAEGGKPLLLDFGAARRVIGDMTQALTVILKPGYAPVEQYAEVPGMRQGPWTDVYALAATVYWTILGRTPPPSVGRTLADSYEPLAQAAAGRYSARFLSAIDNALAVLPDRRTQTIDALRADLSLAGSAAPVSEIRPVDPDATVIRVPTRATVSRPVEPRSEVAPTPSVPPRVDATSAPGSTRAATISKATPSGGSRRLRLGVGIGLSLCVGLAGVAWWTLRPAPVSVVSRPAPSTIGSAVPKPATATPQSPADAIRLAKLGASPTRTLSVRAISHAVPAAADATEFGSKDRWGLSVTSSAPGYLYVFGSRDGERTLRLLWPTRLDASDRRDAGSLELNLGPTNPPLAAGTWSLLVLVSETPRHLAEAGWRNDGSVGLLAFDGARDAALPSAWGGPSCASGATACEDLYGADTLSLSIVESAPQPPPAPPPAEIASVKPRPAAARTATPSNPGGGVPKDAAAPTRKAAAPAQSVECAQIFQRLSLGESQAGLMERAKALGCR
jgi:serine/threonine protein kinase